MIIIDEADFYEEELPAIKLKNGSIVICSTKKEKVRGFQ